LTAPGDPAPAETAARRALAAVAARDLKAFEALYRLQHRRLTRFLRRLTSRADVIDEVVNETMWIVWCKAAGFRGDSTVDTWITGIAYRSMLKALRGTAPAAELGECLLDPAQLAEAAAAAAPGDGIAERDDREWVAHGLRSLPDDQRLTLELAYVLGHTCEEIASVMGCAVGTVKARMFHARVRLRNLLPVLSGERPRGGRLGARP
jgi:RNA polymerase sigma-70 factor, ECF subfamily